MRGFILALVILAIVVVVFIKFSNTQVSAPTPPAPLQSDTQTKSAEVVIAQNLDTPWAIAFLPSGSMLVTERVGRVRLISSEGELQEEPAAIIKNAKEIGEGGLLGIALHPDFSANHLVYLYYTYSSSGDNTLNRVVRIVYKDNKLSDEKIIVDNIPGASNHNGGRIKFGPDGYLYITTGDVSNPSLAQDTKSLAGKILRVDDEGNPHLGSAFGGMVGFHQQLERRIYTIGHRNSQGLAWDNNGNLWSTEHGSSKLDEINLIESGKNYGWPEIQGNETKIGMETPVQNSGSTTWAPAGAAIFGNSLFFGGLRGQALYEAVIDGNRITEVKEYFKDKYGRIREVVLGPDNMLYITTSNKDGRGTPDSTDDKIIRINPDLIGVNPQSL